jgi:hypothetical protein
MNKHDEYDPWNVMKGECEYLALWAAKHQASLMLEGMVGFGRSCVGILVGSHYPDWHAVTEDYTDAWWVVEEARPPAEVEDYYHKHDCLAVSGHSYDALRQLYIWVQHLEANNVIIEVLARKSRSSLELMFHGTEQPVLTTRERIDAYEG